MFVATSNFKYEHLPHFISLGAGVQSSALALMYATGDLTPMPKAAIFADTQSEPNSVYKWLEWLEKELPFPVHQVTSGSLAEHETTISTQKSSGKKYRRNVVPMFGLNEDGSVGMLNRGCTVDFKINALRKKLRELAAIKRGEKKPQAVQVIGISLDEFKRMKPSREKWWVARWPLIEQRKSREHCLDWMRDKGYPTPPRSACVFCPFHTNREWRRLQKNEPEEFEKAVKFEQEVQAAHAQDEVMKSFPFLHKSCKPLNQVDFRSDVERGQQLLWDDECEGMCGI